MAHYLIGKKFGRLTPITKTNSFYRCRCDCGTETTVRSDKLITGATQSCGCLRREMREQAKREAATSEEIKAKAQEYYQENKSAICEQSRRWRLENAEAYNAYQKKYREKVRLENEAKKKVRKKGAKINRKAATGKMSKGLIPKLYIAQKECCVYCDTHLGTNFHVDHKLPLVLGGSGDDSNLQLLCPDCNVRKGGTHPDDFERDIGFTP